MNYSNDELELSVILPCQNEEQSLAGCIKQIKEVFSQHKINGEIIVSDSSTDGSPRIANDLGVKLIKHDKQGYGRAYLEGFKEARGKYLFLADADGTYNFEEIPHFLEHLRTGYDLVMGNRFLGKIESQAMPALHRYIGNPVLSSLLRIFFKTKIGDIHCGMRAIKREALDRLNLRTTGMEFASEMLIMAGKEKLAIKELPIDYFRRKGKSKLKSFPDGWRHLRFMLMYAPNYLFIIPGIIFFIIGLVLIFLLSSNVIYGCFLIILGFQITTLGIYLKAYLKSTNFIKQDKLLNFLARIFKFETGIIMGFLFILLSFLLSRKSVFSILEKNINLSPHSIIIIALTISVIGIQMVFFSFLISILLIEKHE